MAHIGYGYGSEWHLLEHLGRRRAAFTRQIESLTGCQNIRWRDYDERHDPVDHSLSLREPRGLEFLAPLDPIRQEWERIWPQSGNVHNWDAVGQAMGGTERGWILVEAKAHIGELASSCSATAEESRTRIQDVLDRARRDLGVMHDADWSRHYYQYCNRLALLHFLRGHHLNVHLVFVYFTGDRTELGAPGRKCPVSEAEWQDALAPQEKHAGLPPNSPLRQLIHRVFLPAYRTSIAEQVLKAEYCRPRTVSPSKAD